MLFCVFHTPKYCCLSHEVLVKKDIIKFLDAVSGHLTVSLTKIFFFQANHGALQKSALFKTHRTLPFISIIRPGYSIVIYQLFFLCTVSYILCSSKVNEVFISTEKMTMYLLFSHERILERIYTL